MTIGVKELFIFYQLNNTKIQILKTVSYRILGSFTTVILSLVLGLPINWALILGVGELFLKPVLYFLHEVIWDKYFTRQEYQSDKIF